MWLEVVNVMINLTDRLMGNEGVNDHSPNTILGINKKRRIILCGFVVCIKNR